LTGQMFSNMCWFDTWCALCRSAGSHN